jgi:hypothetical protein
VTSRLWTRTVVAATALVLGAGIAVAPAANAADPNPTLVDQFDAVGTSHIGSVNATLPITSTTLTETLDLVTFNVLSGTLPVPSQVVQFKALGIAPVRATVSLVQATPITGKINVNDTTGLLSLNANVSYTVKLSNVSVNVFGVWVSLGIGNSCQTINPAKIAVATPAGQSFDVIDGGTVTGKYTIGQFKNCAPLNFPDILGIGSIPINALVPGTNNTISLQLSNGRFAG